MKYVDWSEMPDMTNSINFMGIYNNSQHYNYGDICVYNNEIWIYDGTNTWIELGQYCHNELMDGVETEVITQCRNCGAPTYENGQCPYCGTINKKVRKFNAR